MNNTPVNFRIKCEVNKGKRDSIFTPLKAQDLLIHITGDLMEVKKNH